MPTSDLAIICVTVAFVVLVGAVWSLLWYRFGISTSKRTASTAKGKNVPPDDTEPDTRPLTRPVAA